MTAVCHCTHCQRQTGTAFSVLVAVPRGSIQMEGSDPHVYFDVGESGQPVLRKFCAQCGSPIYSEVAATPQLDWIKAGTLDDTSWLQPQVHIWCDSAQPWVHMDESVARVPRNPPME
ncbi:MAG: GFA family protein [Rhodocyclaceae bacterium]|nr:GFA family protein [Rhodocyclaceae bacterium]